MSGFAKLLSPKGKLWIFALLIGALQLWVCKEWSPIPQFVDSGLEALRCCSTLLRTYVTQYVTRMVNCELVNYYNHLETFIVYVKIEQCIMYMLT